MDIDKLRKMQGKRLRAIRIAAGFSSARSAALDCGWPESTYRAHEGGTRTIGQDDAIRYVNRFRIEGAKGYTAQWLLFGDDRSLDDMIRDQPPDVVQRAYEAVLAEIEKGN
jgi:hypothetical protein